MIEAARLGVVLQVLEAFGHAVKTKRVQFVESRMSEHEDIFSMVVAGTAHMGVVESVMGLLSAPGESNLRASSDATPLQLRTPSSTARAETASRRAGSRPR